MSARVEYVTPTSISFCNELDLADEVHIEDAEDADVLVLNYDEIVVIPGGRDEQLALADRIRNTVLAQTGPDGRAVRAGQPLPAAPATDPVTAFIRDHFNGDATEAMLACARHGNIPVHYLTRDHFDGFLGRDLTDEEWADLDVEDFDAFVDDSGDVDSDYIDAVLTGAGLLDPDDDTDDAETED